MEMIYSYLAIALGIALRIGIPILITVLISIYLHRLDERWQAEGEEIEAAAPVEKPECWKITGCLPEQRATCPGYLSALPCWQARRLPNGYLREECLTCLVFRRASVPAVAHA
jgi:hypothetical protein